MSKHKPIAALLFLVTTATALSACDPSAILNNSLDRPTKLCADIGDGHCPKPPSTPDDIAPN